MIRLKCKTCELELDCSDFLAGLTIVCKGCGHRIPVPGSQQPEASADAAVPAPPPAPLPSPPPPPPSSESRLDPPPWPNATPLNERAEAMLDAGMPVPMVEERLVALGLTPDVANALMIKILGERAKRQEDRAVWEESKRDWLWYKLTTRWWGQFILSTFFFAVAWLVQAQITELETMGRARLNVIVALVYGLAGKWGAVLICVAPGLYFAYRGIRSFSEVLTGEKLGW